MIIMANTYDYVTYYVAFMNSFNSPTSVREVPLSFLHSDEKNKGEKLSDLPKVTDGQFEAQSPCLMRIRARSSRHLQHPVSP